VSLRFADGSEQLVGPSADVVTVLDGGGDASLTSALVQVMESASLEFRAELAVRSTTEALETVDIFGNGCRADFPLPETAAALRSMLCATATELDPAVVAACYIDTRRGWNKKRNPAPLAGDTAL
jgi:hypothetical protein